MANSIPAASASWFPDSGAFFHVTNDAKNLQQLTPIEGPDQIYMGNGQGLHIQSSGSSVFTSPIHPHTPLTFHNLLLIPTITKNLLSVSQFCRDNNVYFLFDANKCFVLSQVNNDVLLEGQVGKDGLYEFPSLTLASSVVKSQPVCSSQFTSSINSVSVDSSSPNVWHLRLGHHNSQALKLVLQSCNVPIHNKISFDFVATCCMGKAHRLHSPSSHTTYFSPLELVYSDL